MAGVRDYQELDVWKLCEELRVAVRAVLARPTFRRALRLGAQLDQSTASPVANVAEGFSRFYPRDNARFVRMAKGSLSETLVHLKAAAEMGLVDAAELQSLSSLARRARGAATRYIIYLESPRAQSEARRAAGTPR